MSALVLLAGTFAANRARQTREEKLFHYHHQRQLAAQQGHKNANANEPPGIVYDHKSDTVFHLFHSLVLGPKGGKLSLDQQQVAHQLKAGGASASNTNANANSSGSSSDSQNQQKIMLTAGAGSNASQTGEFAEAKGKQQPTPIWNPTRATYF